MQKHKTYDKLTVQGNVYPMPTMAFIEDDKHRFTILSANSLGFSNLKPGKFHSPFLSVLPLFLKTSLVSSDWLF